MKTLPASFALAALLSPWALAAQKPPTFSEDVTVREASVIVDVPDTLHGKALVPADVRVFEDGQARPVTRVEPFPHESDVVLYFDAPLARSSTRFASALALGRQAAGLAALGPVEVVAADPAPRSLLPSGRDAEKLATQLGEVAARARVENGTFAKVADPAVARRQLDRLLLFLAGRPAPGPHILLYVADGTDTPALGPLYDEAGRTLASYGWTVVGFSVQSNDPGKAMRQRTDLNRVIDTTSRRDDPTPATSQPKPSDLQFDTALDPFVRTETASLRSLTQPTAGTLIGIEKQLVTFFAALPEKRRVWYQPLPVDGKAHPLEVRLAAGGKILRGQAQARSATPPAVAEARLRALLAGEAAAGTLPLTAAWAPGHQLSLRLAGAADAPTVAGALRLSLAFETPAGITYRHETLAEELVADGPWSRTVAAAPPAGTRRVALVLEDLKRDAWGGAVLAAAP